MWVHHHDKVWPEVSDGGYGLQMWKVTVNVLNKHLQIANKRWSSDLGVG